VAAVTEAEPSTRRRHLGGGVLASGVAQVAALASTAISSVLIARILGADGLGAFALGTTFTGIALLCVGLGTKQGIIFLVGSGAWPLATVGADLVLPLVVMGSLGIALMFAAYELLRESALQPLPSEVVPVLAASIVFGLVWQWSWSLALALERYEAYAATFVAPAAATLVLSPALALAFGLDAALIGAAAAQAVAGLGGFAWTLRSGTRWRPSGGREGRRKRLEAVFRFGLQAWGSELFRYTNLRLDLFFVAAYTSAAQVGKYSVAAAVTSIGLILPQALGTAIQPRTAILKGATTRGEIGMDDADISDARACRHTVLMLPLSALVVLVLLLVGVPVLYGSEFHRTIGLGLILLPGVLALGLAQVMTSIVQGRGRADYALYSVLLTVVPTVAGYVLVIPDSGATGAAVVSLCSYSASAVVAYWFFRRETGIRARFALIPSRDEFSAYRDVLRLTVDYGRTVLRRR
jgi:O-antigen/teichoic acid export membrane protein